MKVSVVVVIQIVALVTLTRADGGQSIMGKLGGALTNMQGKAKDIMAGGNIVENFKGMMEMMMGLLDTDKDGSITAEEWGAATRLEEFAKFSKTPWEKISNMSDDNCDNKISTKEFGSYMALGAEDAVISKETVGEDTYKTLLADHDTDKDGKISKEEYIAYKMTVPCAGCSLTAAISTLGLILMANLIF